MKVQNLLPRFSSATDTIDVRGVKTVAAKKTRRKAPIVKATRQLLFWENMVCGAVSRSMAQTIMHPANTMKTILQSRGSQSQASLFGVAEGEALTFTKLARLRNLKVLTRGAGAQFIMSVPHGAVNFAVLELVRKQMDRIFQHSNMGFGLDFLSSCVATFCCSVVSTPQMVRGDFKMDCCSCLNKR